MQNAAPVQDNTCGDNTSAKAAPELAGMLATLCSYESFWGTYHPHTLRLMTSVGLACWQQGECATARVFLERAIRDVGRVLGRTDELRLQALAALRDLYLQQREMERAGALQRELWECCKERLGEHHPETLAACANLATIMLQTSESVSTNAGRANVSAAARRTF